jgi:L-alanine-DL-glutamate epimerase-like enolase superfamily enzyme
LAAYKFCPAAGAEKDLATVQQIREAVGPDFDLMVDAHTWWRMGDENYSPEAIEQLAGELASHNIAWLEEPLPPGRPEGYLSLKEKDLVPLASGRLERDEQRLLDLVATQAVDYVQMDVCLDGGYAKARRVFAEIARQGLRFAFHSSGTALEAIAAAQLGVCWPAQVVEWLEYPCYAGADRAVTHPSPLAQEILREPLEIARGHLTVPRTPGLGVRVDESVVERYPWIPGPWSYFRTDSPAETRPLTAERYGRWERRTA